MRSLEELKQAVCAAIDAHRQEIIAIGEDIWKHPEPGFREFRTSELAAKVLRDLGMPVQEKLALTGLRADYAGSRPGPAVAIMGEMDSLILPTHPQCDPQTGAVHACGHHAHITGMLGAAIGLCHAQAAQELSGKVVFLATPAEECIELDKRKQMLAEGKISALGGKQAMLRDGVFEDIDIAFMHHMNSSDKTFLGHDANGFVMKSITFHGKSCHAACACLGVNALSIATLAQDAIGLLRETYVDSSIRVHGILTAGGDIVNVIPDTVKLEYMLRGRDMELVQELSAQFDRAMHGCAAALGGTAEIVTSPGYANLQCSDALYRVFRQQVHALRPDVTTPESTAASFSMASTDCGDVSQMLPALETLIPGCQGAGHSIDFRPGDPELAYILQAKISALMVIDLLYGDAELGRRIAAEKQQKLTRQQYIAMMDALGSSR